MINPLNVKVYNPPKKQESMKEKIIYYCSCCNSECVPILKKPIIENKIMDKIEVRFD